MNLNILILDRIKRNIVKQTDVGIFCIHEKVNGVFLFEFAQVIM